MTRAQMINPCKLWIQISNEQIVGSSTSGLVIEYIVAIDVTRVRFPAGTYFRAPGAHSRFPMGPFSCLGARLSSSGACFRPQELIFRPQELTCRLQELNCVAQEAPRRLPETFLRLPEAPEAQNS